MTRSIPESIAHLAYKLPDLPAPPPKGIIEILGIGQKEAATSRMLAYFLRKEEDHHLGDVFFQALKNLIPEKAATSQQENTDKFVGEYWVHEEVTTRHEQKRIDILIESADAPDADSWAIIIENKLYHTLDSNPLDIYWKHPNQKHKVGIVLSLFKQPEHLLTTDVDGHPITYLNFLHQDLIQEIGKVLDLSKSLSHRTHFYLQEYFHHIQSQFPQPIQSKIMDQLRVQIFQHYSDFKKILQAQIDLEADLKHTIESVLEEVGFAYYDRTGEWWYFSRAPFIGVRLGIRNLHALVSHGNLEIVYELYGGWKVEEYASSIREKGADFFNQAGNPLTPSIQATSKFIHLAWYSSQSLLKEEGKFRDGFKQLIDQYYLGTEAQPGVVSLTEAHLKMARKEISDTTSSIG